MKARAILRALREVKLRKEVRLKGELRLAIAASNMTAQKRNPTSA
jgi:hypothetical protein